MRVFPLFAAVLVVALAAAPEAWAKDKPRPTPNPQTTNDQQNAALDPTNPDDLAEILRQADVAHYPENGERADFGRAFDLYTLAATVGDPTALNQLGLMYDFGDYVGLDDEQAVSYYQQAADAGSSAGKNNLALMYLAGEGTAKDSGQALYWFRQAAADGYGFSMYHLGNMFRDGEGVAVDNQEAVAWYEKAVDAGNANAHWALGLQYLYGNGVGKDSQRAAELAYYALTNGVEVALTELKGIRGADTSPNFRRALQELMKRDGYYDGPIDGSFGPKTMAAVEAAYGGAL